MRLFFAMPLVALLCGCQDETTLYLWIDNKTDDTLVVEVSRRNMAHWPVREFTIPPGWNHSLGTWDERGICDDCSQFMEPWLWMDSLVLNSHEWVNPKFPQGEWDFHLHEGSTYRQFNHTLEVTARDIE